MEHYESNTRPRVTIVIPTFNSGDALGRCLDSVLGQSFPGWEIVAVDGGSTDGTVELLEATSQRDPRVRFVSGPDRGVYDAMNKGVQLAFGEWILFLGSDDSLYSGDVLERIQPHLQPNLELVYGDVRIHGDVPWSTGAEIYDGEFDSAKLLERNISHQCIFYRHEVFTRFGGYSLRYRVWADWEFNARIFRHVRKKHVDVVVANFYAGGLSTQRDDTALREDLIPLFTRYFRLSPFHSFYKQRIAEVESLIRRFKQRRALLPLAYFGLIWTLHGYGRWQRIRGLLRPRHA
jgi:glycosyltransferase involved in cell wall biosynthesis